jgi:N-glycosylase/DNA lyase
MPTVERTLASPPKFRLAPVAMSHGWYDLPPFEWDRERHRLATAVLLADRPADLVITEPKPGWLTIELTVKGRIGPGVEQAALDTVTRLLNLELDPAPFFAAHRAEFGWAEKLGGGRLLRGATVFEDAVKTLATTNCSWSLTKLMTTRIIDALGEPAPSGRRAFPRPSDMATMDVGFYRDTVKAGYRADRFRAFAAAVEAGTVDPEAWANPATATDEVMRSIRANPGFGPYAAENLGRILGRYDGLGIDSWCLKKFPEIHGPVQGDVAKAIRRHYDRYGSWRGLALWLDLTRDWHAGSDPADTGFKKA